MIRLLLAIVTTVGVVVFVMVNTHHVPLSFIVGPPVRIRMIFLLMVTFIAGMLTTSLLMMLHKVRRRVRTETPRADAAPGQEQ